MNKKQRVVIIGGKGNGMVIAQIILDLQATGNDIELLGFLNDDTNESSIGERWPILGKPVAWQNLDDDVHFVYGLLSVGKMRQRIELLNSLNIPLSRLASLIHPTSVIGFNSEIKPGSVICSHVSIQPNVKIGANCIVRSGANIGHDVTLDGCVDIGPNVSVCGYTKIQQGCHIAANAVVRDNLTVANYSVLGAGAVLLRDTQQNSTWLGNPARRIS